MKPIQYIDEPNMILPLAVSYNTRGIIGFTQTITNARDQRKVNCVYEPITNSQTKKATLYLAKRPGSNASGTYGTAGGQIAYLSELRASANGAGNSSDQWVFTFSTSTVRVNMSSPTSSVVIFGTDTNFRPAYVDKTSISGTDTVVLQLRTLAGSSKQRIFYSQSSSAALWTEISTSNVSTLSIPQKMEFLDGYAFLNDTYRIVNSDLNSLDSWPSLGYISRRARQDIGTGLARLGPLIISYGTATMELYRNGGTSFGSPLEFVGSHDYGLALSIQDGSRHYYAVLRDRLYWYGSTPGGAFAFNGQTVEKVSTPAIDKILTTTNSGNGPYHVCPIMVQGRSAVAFALDAPNSLTQRALMFFPEWNDWFEWNSTVFQPVASQRTPNLTVGVSTSTHKLFALEFGGTSNWQDAGVDYTMTVQFKLPNNGNAHRQLKMFGVKGDTAASNTTSVLNVRFSTDDWQTSSAARTIDMTQAKKHIYRCGAYRDLGVYLDHTANLDCRLEAIVARVE